MRELIFACLGFAGCFVGRELYVRFFKSKPIYPGHSSDNFFKLCDYWDTFLSDLDAQDVAGVEKRQHNE